MKKRLFKKAIITIVVFCTFVTGISLVIMYYLGDRLLEEAIKAEITDIEKSVNNEKQISDTSIISEISKISEPYVKSSGSSVSPDSQKKTADVPKGDTNKAITKAEKQITIDKIKEIKDKVVAADKMKVAALVLKRLSASDIDELKKMLIGGVSAEEKERAKQLVYLKFTKDEIVEIKGMYTKYMQNI